MKYFMFTAAETDNSHEDFGLNFYILAKASDRETARERVSEYLCELYYYFECDDGIDITAISEDLDNEYGAKDVLKNELSSRKVTEIDDDLARDIGYLLDEKGIETIE